MGNCKYLYIRRQLQQIIKCSQTHHQKNKKKEGHEREEVKNITCLPPSCCLLFIPLLCLSVSVPGLWPSGESCRKWFFKVFISLSCASVSVHGPWASGEPCRKWFFKSSYHFYACRYPFKAHGQTMNRFANGSSGLYTTFMRVDIRSRPMAKQGTVS